MRLVDCSEPVLVVRGGCNCSVDHRRTGEVRLEQRERFAVDIFSDGELIVLKALLLS